MAIIINDLQTNTVMDSKEMAGVRGGMGMAATQTLTILPHRPKKPGYGFGHPTNVVRKSLSNISEQLNIAVGSFNVMQVNSNTVTQH